MTTSVPSAAPASGLSGRLRPPDILAEAPTGRPVIQDFRPLADSLEWELGQRYWLERGSRAFLSDPVPFVVNNDGNLSMRCAEVFFTSLVEAARVGELEPNIYVLELGIGVGLFGRFFLDAFRDLCEKRGKDFYNRLCYVAADRSPQMLLDACRNGTFANHPGRYLLRVADAICPERTLLQVPELAEQGPRPFRAVFLNYILDCLPVTVLRVEGGEVKQLFVRTCLASNELREKGPGDAEELAQLAASSAPADRRALMGAYDRLVAEYDYRPVDVAQVPYGDFAVALALSTGSASVLHNHGALQALERLFDLVRKGGLILINDYGQAEGVGAEGFEHQRFSGTTAVGLNFPLLRAYFSPDRAPQWVEPEEDKPSVHARMLGNRVGDETIACFRERFGPAALAWLVAPAQAARGLVEHGRLEAARAAYREALERQPLNWALMGEAAQFLTFSLAAPRAGLEMARAALALSPTCSTELWNVLGDSLYALERFDEARKAYRRALRINPRDVRTHFNLAWAHNDAGEHADALQQIAEALAQDEPGTFRDRLLRLQGDILSRADQRQHQRYQLMFNRVSPLLTSAKGERPNPPGGSGEPAGRSSPAP